MTAYFFGLVYFHDTATVAADWLKYKLTITYYNPVLLVSGLGFSLLIAFSLWMKVRERPELRIFLIWFLITILFMLLALLSMMVVNMEAIHYLQYAILAILVFPVFRRFNDAFVLTATLGILDEIYQYLVLNPTFNYFDFNDIILNMLGAGAGLLFIAVNIAPDIKPPRKWYSSSSFIFLSIVIFLGIIFSVQLYVSFFPVPGNFEGWHWFSLYRQGLPDEFWTFLYRERYYHILRPWEGIGMMVFLTLFYGIIDYIYQKIIHD